MIARIATIDDLQVGQEVIYCNASEYRPPRAYHGTITRLWDPTLGTSPTSRYRSVRLDSLNLPVRFFVANPLFIIGS